MEYISRIKEETLRSLNPSGVILNISRYISSDKGRDKEKCISRRR